VTRPTPKCSSALKHLRSQRRPRRASMAEVLRKRTTWTLSISVGHAVGGNYRRHSGYCRSDCQSCRRGGHQSGPHSPLWPRAGVSLVPLQTVVSTGRASFRTAFAPTSSFPVSSGGSTRWELKFGLLLWCNNSTPFVSVGRRKAFCLAFLMARF